MNSQVKVRSIGVLEDLRSSLLRFSAETQQTLIATSFEIQRIQEWLAQRHAQWKREILRRQQMLQQVQAALQQCKAQVTYVRQTGRTYRPDCSALEVQVARTRSYLAEAETELQNVAHWVRLVQQAIANYQRQSQHLTGQLSHNVPQAAALLGRIAADLHTIAAMTPPATGSGVVSSPVSLPAGKPAGTNLWLARGIRNVPLHRIGLTDSSVQDRGDFHKVAHEEMRKGIQKLEAVVRPAVENGADGEHFSQMDARLGLDYAHGYRCVYDAFYGESGPIRLNQIGDSYEVVNGYHRLFVAQELGLESVPAQVVAPATPQEQFRHTMAALDSRAKGAWGERQLQREIAHLGHRSLLLHEQPNMPGYDGVSWDGRTIHIWEVKNYSAGTPAVSSLSALENRRLLPNVAQFMQEIADEDERPTIAQAVQDNAVQMHIRLGPDTDIYIEPIEDLSWAAVDVRQYSYEQMLETDEG